ncbi:hypothetical protein HPB51_020099 [Rhipicephalus microplus]|uniref:Uncharacterized protein n=1 Tax=Rhipicephalus microplus TaxID=6941 RepID=A0A9J6EIB1_RHIMP|nr:hypothetical protein HPB51_020099 [Rhipicephalus microplus]
MNGVGGGGLPLSFLPVAGDCTTHQRSGAAVERPARLQEGLPGASMNKARRYFGVMVDRPMVRGLALNLDLPPPFRALRGEKRAFDDEHSAALSAVLPLTRVALCHCIADSLFTRLKERPSGHLGEQRDDCLARSPMAFSRNYACGERVFPLLPWGFRRGISREAWEEYLLGCSTLDAQRSLVRRARAVANSIGVPQ